MPPLLWHAHEMLYGFAVAVIVGFLLTAGKAWTGLATPRGATLAAMAGLWLAARLLAPFSLPAAAGAGVLGRAASHSVACSACTATPGARVSTAGWPSL